MTTSGTAIRSMCRFGFRLDKFPIYPSVGLERDVEHCIGVPSGMKYTIFYNLIISESSVKRVSDSVLGR